MNIWKIIDIIVAEYIRKCEAKSSKIADIIKDIKAMDEKAIGYLRTALEEEKL